MNNPKILNANEKQNVSYCIDTWVRDEQIKLAIKRVKGRIQPVLELRQDPIAVVGFGPSLNDTWEELKKFKYIISCSGAHKFLIERNIIPTWDVTVDPRPHKVKLIGPPHKDVEYLIASACHQAVFDHLENYNVKLWHVFANDEESLRLLPKGEWSITGGCSVGLRAMTLARFLGFTDLHIFGLDGNESDKYGKHAAEHPMQPHGHALTEYPLGSGVMWKTTQSMLEVARQTFYELDQMSDVKATFYGEGLIQTMAKDYKPKPANKTAIGYTKPELITQEYRELNIKLHNSYPTYGAGGGRHADNVIKLIDSIRKSTNQTNISVLDYGCGRGYLGKELAKVNIPICEYDPAIFGKEEPPRPADLVVCTDVLEHIEPDKLMYVLDDLRRCTKQVGFFTISTRLAQKKLADGRNAHLIVENEAWWEAKLKNFFEIGKIINNSKLNELMVIVGPKQLKIKKKKK